MPHKFFHISSGSIDWKSLEVQFKELVNALSSPPGTSIVAPKKNAQHDKGVGPLLAGLPGIRSSAEARGKHRENVELALVNVIG